MKTWNDARTAVKSRQTPVQRRLTEREVIALAGPCAGNRYYVDGVAGESAPLHVEAYQRVEEISAARFLPYEVRLPSNWLTLVGHGYGIEPAEMYAVRQAEHRPVSAAWLGLDEPGDPSDYERIAAAIRRDGHTPQTVTALGRLLGEPRVLRDQTLSMRIIRALCVGVGRGGSAPADVRTAVDSGRAWLATWAGDDAAGQLDVSLMLRSLAFADLPASGPQVALEEVRRSAEALSLAEKNDQGDDGELSFRIREAWFPTLETLALCESKWGSAAASLDAAAHLVSLFPHDARSWIRLAKSRWELGDTTAAVTALLTAATAETPRWLVCLHTAALIAAPGEGDDEVDRWLEQRGIAKRWIVE